MTGMREWVRAMVCGGTMLAAGGMWLAPQVAMAGQRAGEQPAVAARGDAARGKYIVESVAMCGECHSTRDQAGNIVAGTRYLGGPMPVRAPWPGDWPIMVPRIAGLPGYSDIEAQRLLTEGAIKRNGTQALAPMPRFRMTPEDAAAVIAFMRAQ